MKEHQQWRYADSARTAGPLEVRKVYGPERHRVTVRGSAAAGGYAMALEAGWLKGGAEGAIPEQLQSGHRGL